MESLMDQLLLKDDEIVTVNEKEFTVECCI